MLDRLPTGARYGDSPPADTLPADTLTADAFPADALTADALTADAGHGGALYADAVGLLADWHPPTAEAAAALDRTRRLLDEHGPAALTREHQAGHLTASTLVLDATGGRVLLCLHGRYHRWVQLGGHCEAGDLTMAGAALREATEESGIDGLRLDPVPIDLDIHPVGCAGGSWHHDVRFVAVAPAGAVERVSAESVALGWFPPHALPEPLAGATEQLVAPALAAFRRSSLRPGP